MPGEQCTPSILLQTAVQKLDNAQGVAQGGAFTVPVTGIMVSGWVMKTCSSCSRCMACRRLAELREQLKDARAEQKADAAAYANTLEAQQVLVALSVAPHSRPTFFLPVHRCLT